MTIGDEADSNFSQSALTTRYAAGVREARCKSAAALATVIGNERHTKATAHSEREGVVSRTNNAESQETGLRACPFQSREGREKGPLHDTLLCAPLYAGALPLSGLRSYRAIRSGAIFLTTQWPGHGP